VNKVLDFLATTKNINIISILLTLNPKHGNNWGENLITAETKTLRNYSHSKFFKFRNDCTA